ncbi:uncharacterized protein LOC105763120 isoform X1 [Gossypium raimondii]|uniref:uncharacterized protein LOC105763120 isoform X1 n=1 Tax=Gossypium raimondii TaxID=29730 RepID=UPI00227D0944|nr:uncharacterized protein LOC105763120 isoform X1 [Gossypium raimondii]
MLSNQISTIIPGDNLAILRAELKSQNKYVKNLKKKSLWSRILEEVMEKLVDIVHFLHLEIHEAFGAAGISGAPQDNNIMLWNAVIFGVYEDWITRNVADVVCIVFFITKIYLIKKMYCIFITFQCV